jgi:NitT/TauT family transport system substrate-binding protein
MTRSDVRSRARFLGGFAAAGAALGTARLARAQTAAVPIRIGLIPSDFAAQPYYAKDTGLFARHGLAPELNGMNNGALIASAIAGGALDVGFSNIPSLVAAHAKGVPVTLIAAANLYEASSPTVGLLAVKRDSKLASAKDFAGKVIAVGAINNVTHLGARAWIDDNGGDSGSVKWIELPISAMAAAVEGDRVDGAILDLGVDPTLGKPANPLRVAAATFTAIAPRFLTGAWFTTPDWLAKNAVAARAFVTAMTEAAQWANAPAHHQASAAILAGYLKESPDEINATPRVTYGTTLAVPMVQPLIDLVARYKLIAAAFPAAEFIGSTS